MYASDVAAVVSVVGSAMVLSSPSNGTSGAGSHKHLVLNLVNLEYLMD